MKNSSLIFRPFERADERDIVDICYRTGHNGDDLTGRNLFNDRRLFAMLFILYYAKFEPANCFVAYDPGEKRVVGYIAGTPDTGRQEKRFARGMIWRIAVRALLYSSWRHPESLRMVFHFNRFGGSNPLPEGIRSRYPAHLHINVLPEYHAAGAGTALLSMFEDRMKKHGAPGIHLVTSERNIKAVPFYEKHGYRTEAWLSPGFWPDEPGVRAIVFVKRFRP